MYTAYQAGRLARDQAEALIVAVVNVANAAAVTVADAGLSVQIEHATGLPTPATGIAPADGTERLQKAVHTILEEEQPDPELPDNTEMRIERLARSEPLEAAQNATIDAMQQQPLEGWTPTPANCAAGGGGRVASGRRSTRSSPTRDAIANRKSWCQNTLSQPSTQGD